MGPAGAEAVGAEDDNDDDCVADDGVPDIAGTQAVPER